MAKMAKIIVLAIIFVIILIYCNIIKSPTADKWAVSRSPVYKTYYNKYKYN